MEEKTILEKLKIKELSEMQKATADALMNGNDDVLVLSPTGSGKTLAYLLPIVQMLNKKDDSLQMVAIVPGRELALQSAKVLAEMGTGLRCMSVYGGRPAMDEHREMRKTRPQVLFATPGRLNDHIEKGNIDTEHVELLIIDEFDKCLNMGFHDEMRKALDFLPSVRRRVLLSATEADSIPHFVRMGHVHRIDFIHSGKPVPERISIKMVRSQDKDKLGTLERLLRALGGQSIVFLNYRDSVERTDAFLRQKGFVTSAFHGGLDQRQREDALYKFSNGSSSVCVATDLASRGLDIPSVDNIIHYHLPLGEDEYVHRVGRTARWDAHGVSFFILGPEEDLPQYLDEEVEEYDIPQQLPLPQPPKMATIYIGKGKMDKISKGDIVGFLCKVAGLEKDDIGRIDVKDRYAYVAVSNKKVKQVLEHAKGEKIKGIKTIVEPVR